MSEGAFSTRLPRKIEPAKLAQQSLTLEGYVPAEALLRVQEAVLTLSNVRCHLSFRVDEQYRRLVEGHLHAEVELRCQRCLEAVPHAQACEVKVALVRDEDRAKDLPAWLDPWLVSESEADLYEFVEDELLLNLPQIAWHEEDCIDPELYSHGDEPEEKSEEERENPFKKLEQLLNKD